MTIGNENEAAIAAYKQSLLEQFPKNLLLLFDALNAIIPFFLKAGGTVKEADQYDDWENIVSEMFKAFVVHAVTDSGDYHGGVDSFHQMGAWKPEKSHQSLVFVSTYKGKQYFLADIGSPDGNSVSAEWLRFDVQQIAKEASIRSKTLDGFGPVKIAPLCGKV